MKICMAVGDVSVENWIKDKIGARCVFTKDCSYRQMVIPVLNQDVPDVLILAEALIGKDGEQGISIFNLAEEIRRTLPAVRIIFIANEHDYESPDDTLLDNIAKLGIYDILCSNPRKNEPLMIKDVIKMIVKPSDYSYAAKFMHLDREESAGKESNKEVAMIDEIPKKNRKDYSNNRGIMLGDSSKEKVFSADEILLPKSQVAKLTSNAVQAKAEITEPERDVTEIKEIVEVTDDTTVLCSNRRELIFRPAVSSDFDEYFSREPLPGPNSFDGSHRRKNILYSNIDPVQLPSARITVVCSARQGVGCSTTALNIAVSLSYTFEKKVLIVDASYENAIFERLAVDGSRWYGLNVIAECYRKKVGVAGRCISKKTLLAGENSERLNTMPEKLEYINLGVGMSENCSIPELTETISELAKGYDHIVIDLNISIINDISKSLLTIADDVICVTTPDVYEINKLLEIINTYKQYINLEGKYKAVINRYVKSPLDIGYLATVLKAGEVYLVRDDKAYVENSSKWLPVYLTVSRRKIRQAYLKIAEGLIENDKR